MGRPKPLLPLDGAPGCCAPPRASATWESSPWSCSATRRTGWPLSSTGRACGTSSTPTQARHVRLAKSRCARAERRRAALHPAGGLPPGARRDRRPSAARGPLPRRSGRLSALRRPAGAPATACCGAHPGHPLLRAPRRPAGRPGEVEDRSFDVEVDDAGVLLDMDSSADYEQLERLAQLQRLPDRGACEVLLQRERLPVAVVDHSVVVERLARRLAEALNKAGMGLNLRLLEAAACYDIARGRPDHAARGAELLSEDGLCPRGCGGGGSHRSLGARRRRSRRGGVALPGRQARHGHAPGRLAERLAAVEARFADDRPALTAARRRMQAGAAIAGQIEEIVARLSRTSCQHWRAAPSAASPHRQSAMVGDRALSRGAAASEMLPSAHYGRPAAAARASAERGGPGLPGPGPPRHLFVRPRQAALRLLS